MGERTSHEPGTISWTDLATTDQDAAKEFYGGVFGWSFEDLPIDDETVYSMAQVSGKNAAAISPQQPSETEQAIPPHWNVYVTVEDVDAASEKTAEAGGSLLAGPFDVMDAGRMSVIADPAGAVLCLWEAKANIGAGIVNVPGALSWADNPTTDA